MTGPGPGTVIDGMRIDAVAGRGGMGTVYRAQELELNRAVALKIVKAEFAAEPKFRERFRREARLAAALDHPHIVPVYRAGEVDGYLFIAMRFVEGTDLARLLGEGPRLPVRDVAEIIAQVAGALGAAHARGLVHRDIKPGNILVARPEGRWHAYLTDFGLTKELGGSGITSSGVTVGTLSYISPEQLEGRPVDGRADIYSLGCTLFAALTGRPPFHRDSLGGVMHAHLNTPPPLLDGPLGPVVARAMAKLREDRYAGAGEFGQAVRAAAAEVPSGQVADLLAPPAAPPEPDTARPTFRRGALIASAVAGALVAGLIAALLTLPEATERTASTTVALSPDARITGAGTPAQRVAQEALIAGFSASAGGADVRYDPAGSGQGRRAFLEGTVQFAGTDAPLNDRELATAATVCGGPDNIFQAPLLVSPIAVIFNLEGVDTVKMSAPTIAKIFNRKITRWNDPAIAAENPGVRLPATAITPVSRSGQSVTTVTFTRYLAAAAGTDWPYKPTAAGPTPGDKGVQNVVTAVNDNPGAIGYTQLRPAGGLGTVELKAGDSHTGPTPEAAGAFVEASPKVAHKGAFNFAFVPGYDTTGTYPLAAVSYVVACTRYADPDVAATVKAYLSYAFGEQGQATATAATGSAAVTESRRRAYQPALDAIGVPR